MADEETKVAVDEPEQETLIQKGDKSTMKVKVYAPFKVYYEGDSYSVTALNATGPFDVLPHHHNFLCMLEPCNLVVTGPKGSKTIKITRALMHVKADSVVVFMDV